MKKIMLLGCLMCSAFAWAKTDYENCIDNEHWVFNNCVQSVSALFTHSSNPKSVEACKDGYKFGLAQCKEVYINKGK